MSESTPPQSAPTQGASSRIGPIITVALLGLAAFGVYRLYEERQKRGRGGGGCGGGLCGGGGGGGGGVRTVQSTVTDLQSLRGGLTRWFYTPAASRLLSSSFTPTEDVD